MMRRFGKGMFFVTVCCLLAWGISRAAISKYQQKRQEVMNACIAARDKLGPAEKKALETKCSTPEINLVSPAVLAPGQTAEVTATGKFPAGSSILFTSDCIEVVNESVAANSYRANVKVNPGCGPQHISAEVISPPCCKSNRRNDAITIAGNFTFDLAVSNGWRVVARSNPPAAGKPRVSELFYTLEFYRSGEAAPFTKRKATLNPSGGESPSYYFSIDQQDPSVTNPMEEMGKIGEAMQNPNLSDAQRDALEKKLQTLMDDTQKAAAKMSDPNYIKQIQAQQAEFGCSSLNLSMQNGALAGFMNCGQKVGSNLKITGTLKFLGK